MKKYLIAIIFFLIIFLLFKAGFGILALLARFWFISIPVIGLIYFMETKKTDISKDKKEKSDPNVIDAEYTVEDEDDDENLKDND